MTAINLLFALLQRNPGAYSFDDTQETREIAAKILNRIGFLPLTIHQVANLLLNDGCPLSYIIEAYKNRELIEDTKNLLYRGAQDSTYHHSLKTVWNINFKRLDPDQRNLINILSLLDPDSVPFILLHEGSLNSQDPQITFLISAHKFNKYRGSIISSSLISQDTVIKKLSIHRLIKEICHLCVNDSEKQLAFDIMVKLIRAVCSVPLCHTHHRPDLWPIQQSYLPHVQSIYHFYKESNGRT